MGKHKVLLRIVFMAVCMSIAFIMRIDNRNVARIWSNGINKQMYIRTNEILNRIVNAEIEERKELDTMIRKLLDQVGANMSEEYWLWDMEEKATEIMSLDIYVDNTENIEYLLVVPSSKIAFLNKWGDENYSYYITLHAVSDGNVKELTVTSGRNLDSLEKLEITIEEIERIINKKLSYVETIEKYKWPQAKQPEYKLEDLQSTELYQNFSDYIEKYFCFSEEPEIYLGLWNGYSDSVRVMYKMREADGHIHYYSTQMELNGQSRNFITEITEEFYERFKLISIRMR